MAYILREIYRLLFEQFTDQLMFSLDPLTDEILAFLLHGLVYKLAFSKVRNLYRTGIISSREAGSFLHWLFRSISFAIAWIGINALIAAYRFVTEHWVIVVCAIGGIILLAVVLMFSYKAISQRGKQFTIEK